MNLLYSLVLTAGLWNGGLVQYDPMEYTHIATPYFIDIGIDVQYGPVFVNGGIRTDMWMKNISSFVPWQNTYSISAGLRVSIIEIGISHACFHPMAPYQWSGKQITPAWEGGSNTIYLRATFSNH